MAHGRRKQTDADLQRGNWSITDDFAVDLKGKNKHWLLFNCLSTCLLTSPILGLERGFSICSICDPCPVHVLLPAHAGHTALSPMAWECVHVVCLLLICSCWLFAFLLPFSAFIVISYKLLSIKNNSCFFLADNAVSSSFHATCCVCRLRPIHPLPHQSSTFPIFLCSCQAIKLRSNYNFHFCLSIGFKLLAHLSLTSNLYIHILTEDQSWLLLGCITLSSFLHIPKFPISMSCGSQELVMDTYVEYFCCLWEDLLSSGFHFPTLTLAPLSECQFPITTDGSTGSSNSRHSSHKGRTAEDCLFPVGKWHSAAWGQMPVGSWCSAES